MNPFRERVCRKCQKHKPLHQFRPNKIYFLWTCRECEAARERAKYVGKRTYQDTKWQRGVA